LSDEGTEERPTNPKVKDVWVGKAGEIWICRVEGQWKRYLSPAATGAGKDFQPGFLGDEEAEETSGDSSEPKQGDVK
jgi:hypothetical protein